MERSQSRTEAPPTRNTEPGKPQSVFWSFILFHVGIEMHSCIVVVSDAGSDMCWLTNQRRLSIWGVMKIIIMLLKLSIICLLKL